MSGKSKVPKIKYVDLSKKSGKDQKELAEKGEKEMKLEKNISKPKENNKSMSLPKFLQNLGASDKKEEERKKKPSKKTEEKPKPSNFGSISSIFNSESGNVSGVQRVFKKSLTFLILMTLFFLVTALLAINFFAVSFWWVLISFCLYSAVSVIFFIVVADRSYVWIALLAQFLLTLGANSFVGQGFSLVTLLTALMISLFTYLAYSEVEKVQLGGRLFSITHITKEAKRMMTTVAIILVSLGSYNSILSQGSADFVRENIYSRQTVIDYFILGKDSPVPDIVANQIIGNTYFEFVEFYGSEPTFRDYIEYNYFIEENKEILTDEEVEEVEEMYEKEAEIEEGLEVKKIEKLSNIVAEDFPEVDYQLNEILTESKYVKVSQEYYVNKVENYTSKDNKTFKLWGIPLPSFDREKVIPIVVGLILFVFLILFKFIWNLLSTLFILIIWQILKMTGFVRIEVETVEAEVVSI